MNYKLIDGSINDIDNPTKTILLNRGIKDWKDYLNLSEDCIYDFELLDNIRIAVDCFIDHIDNKDNIHIIVDSDVDGYTSGSMIYRYIKKLDKEANVTYSLHTKKQHGISKDIVIPKNCNLLIIPDAGSNDVKQCKSLNENGVDIIILDHHICDKKNDYAIIINNQLCNYPNKNFCGAGIVYKFLKAVDEELWNDYADDMLDMVALGNISDVMDMREFETRYYVDCGLKNIKSKLFKALIKKQSFSMKDIINITSVQFYITPILNAMIRIGNSEEKDLLFRAFIETDEVFDYKKRGSTEIIEETIYDRAARLCSNAKARQTKEVSKDVSLIKEIIDKEKINRNKVMFINVSDILGETLTGLVAIKLAEEYNRPCVLLRAVKPEDGNEVVDYGGSCRNFDNSPLESLKQFLCSLSTFNFVQGHDNAAGVSIPKDNVIETINLCNEKLVGIDFSQYYRVDFDIDYQDLFVGFIKNIDSIKNLFGQGVKEPLVYVSNIPVYSDDILIMGKELNSWKVINDSIAFVKFSVDKNQDKILTSYNNLSDNEKENRIYLGNISVVGTVSINNYNNILTPQIIIRDYEFIKSEGVD